MAYHYQVRLAALVYEQYAQGVTETAAVDLFRSKFGSEAAPLWQIKVWYEQFRRGDTRFRDSEEDYGRYYTGINEFIRVQKAFIDEFRTCWGLTSFIIKGRFVITNNLEHSHIIDLYHTNKRQLEYDFSFFQPDPESVMTDPNLIYNVLNIFPLSLQSVLLHFYDGQSCQNVQHLSFGEIDLENLRIVIHSPIQLPDSQVMMQLVGQTPESNLTDGVLGYFAQNDFQHGTLQMITLDQNQQLHMRQVLELPDRVKIYGLIDGHVYGFRLNEELWSNYEDLIIISISTGRVFEFKTMNRDLLGEQPKHVRFIILSLNPLFQSNDDKLCCIDSNLFMIRPFRDEAKSRLFVLNLETYEWNNTGIEFENRHYTLHTDAERSLIVSRWRRSNPVPIRPFYRFLVKPDLLSNYAWLAIKRRFDYDLFFLLHILSNLPERSPFNCPFPPVAEEEADRLSNYNQDTPPDFSVFDFF
ncbi:hypothetical protein M3Y98_01000100 [Aphelenchoides besseyi]|nr:hypothetical protein M3Y98_01000100 [Aphelenchoides besseyi]KAI6195148.1 hypothetical protein M3Y96_01200100 [Aphelenchoides besseyi]